MADTPVSDESESLIDDETSDESDSPESSESPQDYQKIIEQAKACLKIGEEAEQDIRKDALEDIEFSIGKQWPANVQQDRERDGRPCLVINRIPQFVQQITNDQRQNRPAIKVHAVDDGADDKTAKIIQGIIRHIEYNSNAEVAYDTAFDQAARGGFGFWRVLTDFVSPDSFDQDIFIKRIKNQFTVFLDPSAQEPDGSDANWALVLDWIPKDEYREKYPDSEMASLDRDAVGDDAPNWMKEGAVRVAEYFYREYREDTVYLLSTGISVVGQEKLQQEIARAAQSGVQVQVVRSRKSKIPMIKWVKINAVEILDRADWAGKYIPIVPVYGGEVSVNGVRVLEGVVRNAKDSQRMYNYWKSAETEAIALAPRTPFIVAEGQIEGYEEQWNTANRRNHAYLPYKPTTIAGQMAPPPQRQSFEPAVQAITQAAMYAADDLKATTGIYDASLGAQSPDASGIAIQRRNTQAQTSNFHFIDNLTRSLRHTGRILVDLIPRIYDTARSARVIGDDGTQKVVRINDETAQDENGKPILYQLDAGTYDVTIDVGPSYASKRQEAAASMQSLAQSYPKVMDIAGDLFVKNMDWPGSQEIAERIKKTLPPQIVADDAQGPQQIPPQVQAQMQQMGQVIDQLTQHLNETTKIIETKKLDLEHRERVEIMKLQTQAEIELAKLGSRESIELLKHQIGEIESRLQMLGGTQPIQIPNDFNPQQADGGNFAGFGHVGGAPTGGSSPGQPMEGS